MIAGGAVGWYSKLQTIVALSTTEAEYMAAVEAGKEIAWMRNILSEFGYSVEQQEAACRREWKGDPDPERRLRGYW